MTELSTTARTVLPATAPFDFDATLRVIDGFQPGRRDVWLDGAGVRRAFTHPSDPSTAVVAGVTARHDGSPGVSLTVHSAAPLTAAELDDVGGRVSAWLGLTDDRAEFLQIAEADEPVRRLLEVAHGLHQVRFASLSEGAAYFALLQNSAQWYASLHKRRLAIHLGPMARVGDEDFVAFPSFSTLTRLTPEQLAPYVGLLSRATRLAELLAGVATLDEKLLRHGPYEEARAALLTVRGIGTYTAHALLLRVLGRPDAAPLEMEQFQKIAREVYGSRPPSPDELRDRYGRFVGWWAYTCRTALTWRDHERKTQERAQQESRRPGRPSATRSRPVTPRRRLGGTALDRASAPWSPSAPGHIEDGLAQPTPLLAATPATLSTADPAVPEQALPGHPMAEHSDTEPATVEQANTELTTAEHADVELARAEHAGVELATAEQANTELTAAAQADVELMTTERTGVGQTVQDPGAADTAMPDQARRDAAPAVLPPALTLKLPSFGRPERALVLVGPSGEPATVEGEDADD